MTDLEDAAVAYVEAVHGYRASTGKDSVGAAAHMDMCWHDLVVAVGAPCRICERGTCPGSIGSTAPLSRKE